MAESIFRIGSHKKKHLEYHSLPEISPAFLTTFREGTKDCLKLSVVVHTYNLSIWEVKTGELQAELHNKFKASLVYVFSVL